MDGKPDDVNAETWVAALNTQQNMFGNRADCITDYMFDQNTETIARAIMAATAAEREACAIAGRSEVMKFRARVGRRYYSGYHEDMRDAVGTAIRNRA